MNLHSGWIAGVLLLSVIFACDLSNKNGNNSNNSNNSNSNKNKNTSSAPTPNRPADAEVYIERIYMAKDNDGEPGEETSSYEPGDHKVHCLIDLNKAKKGTQIRFVWMIADVEGEKNKQIQATDYTTNSFENKVHGHLKLPYDWPKGTYRVEVTINGNLDKTIDYTIR
jgi:hypothetical protein